MHNTVHLNMKDIWIRKRG